MAGDYTIFGLLKFFLLDHFPKIVNTFVWIIVNFLSFLTVVYTYGASIYDQVVEAASAAGTRSWAFIEPHLVHFQLVFMDCFPGFNAYEFTLYLVYAVFAAYLLRRSVNYFLFLVLLTRGAITKRVHFVRNAPHKRDFTPESSFADPKCVFATTIPAGMVDISVSIRMADGTLSAPIVNGSATRVGSFYYTAYHVIDLAISTNGRIYVGNVGDARCLEVSFHKDTDGNSHYRNHVLDVAALRVGTTATVLGVKTAKPKLFSPDELVNVYTFSDHKLQFTLCHASWTDTPPSGFTPYHFTTLSNTANSDSGRGIFDASGAFVGLHLGATPKSNVHVTLPWLCPDEFNAVKARSGPILVEDDFVHKTPIGIYVMESVTNEQGIRKKANYVVIIDQIEEFTKNKMTGQTESFDDPTYRSKRSAKSLRADPSLDRDDARLSGGKVGKFRPRASSDEEKERNRKLSDKSGSESPRTREQRKRVRNRQSFIDLQFRGLIPKGEAYDTNHNYTEDWESYDFDEFAYMQECAKLSSIPEDVLPADQRRALETLMEFTARGYVGESHLKEAGQSCLPSTNSLKAPKEYLEKSLAVMTMSTTPILTQNQEKSLNTPSHTTTTQIELGDSMRETKQLKEVSQQVTHSTATSSSQLSPLDPTMQPQSQTLLSFLTGPTRASQKACSVLAGSQVLPESSLSLQDNMPPSTSPTTSDKLVPSLEQSHDQAALQSQENLPASEKSSRKQRKRSKKKSQKQASH